MGLHRMYLKSWWGFVYLPLFLAILYCNARGARQRAKTFRARPPHSSRRRRAVKSAEPDRRGRADAEERKAARRRARPTCARSKTEYDAAKAVQDHWKSIARCIGASCVAACCSSTPFLLPALVRKRRAQAHRRRLRRRPGGARAAKCRRKARPRIRRCACARRSPTGSTGSTPRPANTSPTGRVIAVFAYYYEVRGALRLQLADQLGARKHVPDVRHAVHDLRRLCLPRRPARPRRRLLFQVLAARQGDRRHHQLGVLLHLHVTMLWTGWRFAADAVANRESRSPNGASSTGRSS